jgi:rRNA-processing protein FCF1
MGMDQLARIRRAAKVRERARAAFDDSDAERRRLIRDGFSQGIAGEALAEAAGLSVARVYQIRDGRR